MDLKVHKIIPDIKWPHRIVDNFFTKEDLDWIRKSFDNGYRDIEKRYPNCFENGKMKSYQEIELGVDGLTLNGRAPGLIERKGGRLILTGFSAYVPFWSTERIYKVIDDIWKEATEIYPYKEDKNIRRKDFFSYLEFNIYPAGMSYTPHMDVHYKSFSGVVYIGNKGTGTTLMCGDKSMNIVWKNNRSVMFMNCDEERRNKRDLNDKLSTWHNYSNNTDEPRFTVNFNMTHPNKMVDLLSIISQRDANLFQSSKVTKEDMPTFGPIIIHQEKRKI